MDSKRKIIAFSGAMLLLNSLGGCDLQKIEGYFSPDRRLPEGSSAAFNNPHAPLLNPSDKGGTRNLPLENGAIDTIPTVQKSPVVPVSTATMPEIAANDSMNASAASANNSAYPMLANVPPTPDVPSQNAIKSDFKSMTAEQKATDFDRSSLMNDQNATVMTSAQNGRVVDNAENAVPGNKSTPNSDSKKGIGSWFHDLVASDKKPVVEAPVKRVPVENLTENNVPPAAIPSAFLAPPAAGPNNGAPVLHAPVERTAVVAKAAKQTKEAMPATLESPPQALLQVSPQTDAVAPIAVAQTPALVQTPVDAPVAASNTDSSSFPKRGEGIEANRAHAVHASNNDKFSSWMGEVFGDSKKAKLEHNTTASQETALPPAVASETQPAAIAPQPAIDLDPYNSPVSATNEAPVIPSAVATPLPALTPLQQAPVVSNTAPAPSSAPASINSAPLPDISQLSTQNEKPVNLVQPSEYSNYSDNGYLGDARYSPRSNTQSSN